MSEENVEVVRRMIDAWNQGGWQEVDLQGLLHSRVEYHDDRRWPEARSSVGTVALVKRFEEILEVLGEKSQVEVETILAAGTDRVVAIFHFRGQARASGMQHDYRWGYLCRLEQGRIDYMQAYLDPDEALEAAGLPK